MITVIEGEGLAATSPEDARRLVGVYGELAALQEQWLKRLRRGQTPGLAGGSIAAGLERSRLRLAFWAERYRDLVGVELEMEVPRMRYGGRAVRLTRRELELLKFLMEHPGRPYSARMLAALAWGNAALSPEQVRIYVSRLRRRLRDLDVPAHICCERLRGYWLTPSDGPSAG